MKKLILSLAILLSCAAADASAQFGLGFRGGRGGGFRGGFGGFGRQRFFAPQFFRSPFAFRQGFYAAPFVQPILAPQYIQQYSYPIQQFVQPQYIQQQEFYPHSVQQFVQPQYFQQQFLQQQQYSYPVQQFAYPQREAFRAQPFRQRQKFGY